MRRQSYVWTSLLILSFLVQLGLLHGCASTNPLAAATDLNQRAYALYGAFTIAEEQGAKLTGDASIPVAWKGAIRVADAKAKPTADALAQAVVDYDTIQASLKAGTTTQDKLNIAADNLAGWLVKAQADVTALVNAVKNTPGGS